MEEQLDSLESQREFFLEYARKYNYNLTHIYADEGKSGTRIKHRLQLQKLLEDAKAKKFELVLIKDVSRLARNTVDFLTSIRKLKSYRIKVVFVNYDHTSSDSSEFMLTMLGAIAQEESANTSRRVKFGKKVNAQKGRVPNLCYGYNKIKGEYFQLDINQDEAEIVRKIFKMYTQDHIGSSCIARDLNQMGIKTKRNCEWTQNGVIRILKNEIYTGKVINGKEEIADFLTGKRRKVEEDNWIIVKKPELQIISEETYERARFILESRREYFRKTKERISDKHIFSKLIWCKCCGYSFRRIVRTYKNTYIRWVCNGRNSNGANTCPNSTTIDESYLLSVIKEYCLNLLLDKPQNSKYIASAFCHKYKGKSKELLYAKDYISRLNKLENLKEKYIQLYKEDIITIKELKEDINTLEKEMDYLKKELNLINSKGGKIEFIEGASLEIGKNIDKFIKMEELTNARIRRFVEKIVVENNGEVDIYLTKLG